MRLQRKCYAKINKTCTKSLKTTITSKEIKIKNKKRWRTERRARGRSKSGCLWFNRFCLLALKLFPNPRLALFLFLLLDSSIIALYNSTNLTTKEKITISLNSLCVLISVIFGFWIWRSVFLYKIKFLKLIKNVLMI